MRKGEINVTMERMKTVIFTDDKKYQIWFRLEEIRKIYTHPYMHFRETVITLINYQIGIFDEYHQDISKVLRDFMKDRNEDILEMKVKNICADDKYASLHTVDWASQAMKG